MKKIKILVFLAVLFVCLFALPFANPVAAQGRACRNSLWLNAGIDPDRSWWQGERYYLEAPMQINGTYLIINMREYERYDWERWGTVYGPGYYTRFGVSTAWALAHPWWDKDPWLLLYDCD